jgi:hypothetical protein
VEMHQVFNRLAVSIPADVGVSKVMRFLKHGIDTGLIWVDEGTIRTDL